MSQTSIDDKISAPVIKESSSIVRRWEDDFCEIKTDAIIYTYIVVGSDSADAVLVNRFSEQNDKQVLLIEADGTVSTDTIHTPTAGNIDWQYKTVSQVKSHFSCINQQKESNKLNQLFIESCKKNRCYQTKDYNAEKSLNGCISMSQISTEHGKR
ncbi:unnamed protein product [Adineta steineri]|uniref:Uncharacterized protein n=1 Tax=Adineta steineri TaxID=433720 RepID=A0A814BDM5_9BILA|nr:unnamed protein product [Adineta steineri]CAF4067363.1 unnamed protein product [Adineta steineri]